MSAFTPERVSNSSWDAALRQRERGSSDLAARRGTAPTADVAAADPPGGPEAR